MASRLLEDQIFLKKDPRLTVRLTWDFVITYPVNRRKYPCPF
jgi:hypothetical protein